MLIALGALCYAQTLTNPFVFDDRVAIVENMSVHTIAGSLIPSMNTPVAGRPAATLSFALNYHAGGLDVTGYHAVNVAIHLAAGLLLFGVVRRTLGPHEMAHSRRDAAAVAAVAAAVWIVHPLNTEAVNYVTQRTESLMGLLFVATLYASVRSLASPRRRRWEVAAIAACALGMACKEAMVTAPIVVVLYDRAFAFGSVRAAFSQRRVLYAGFGLTWVILAALIAPGPRSGSAGFATSVGVVEYLLNQPQMILRYLRLAIWPSALVINYGAPQPMAWLQVLPEGLLVVGLLLAACVAAYRWPKFGFSCLVIFVVLAPTTSIVPIATEVGAERRMYVPLMALCAIAAWIGHALMHRRQWSRVGGASVAVALVTVLGITTQARHREYASALELARTTLSRWPTPDAHAMLGAELAALGRDRQALDELRQASPTDPRAQYNLGITLFNERQYGEATRVLTELVASFPMREEIPLARRAIGNAQAAIANWPAAIAEYRAVLAMRPADAVTHRLLADALDRHGVTEGSAGRASAAIVAFREALAIDPANARTRLNLAEALLVGGHTADALLEVEAAAHLHGETAGGLDVKGRALAMDGRLDDALAALERAKHLDSADPVIEDDLAHVRAARAASGRRRD